MSSAQEDVARPQGLSADLSYPQPPVEKLAKTPAQIDEIFASSMTASTSCAPGEDHFPGGSAVLLDATDRRRPEASAHSSGRARRLQILTHVRQPLVRPQYAVLKK